jgi:hypothetical protein
MSCWPTSKATLSRLQLGTCLMLAAGLTQFAVARRVVTAIRQNELYVFTHAGSQWRSELAQRFNQILLAMDRAATAGG